MITKLIQNAFAQELIPCPDGSLADPSIGCVTVPGSVVDPESSLLSLILRAADGALSVVAGVAVIFLIYGGIRYAMAAGDDEKINKAKRMMIWSVFGLVLSLLAVFVVQFVLEVIA